MLTLLVGARNLPGPLATAARLAGAFGQPGFIEDLAATARAYAIALAIAMGGGVALGLLFGGWRAMGDTFEPAMHILVSVPKVALYPIILLLFGLGDPAKIAFGVLHGLPTVVIITAGAIRSLKPIYRKAALTMRLSPRHYALHVLLPAVAPEILASFRICFAFTLDRHPDRRDVRLGARARPSPDGLDRRRRHADGHGDHRPAVPVRRRRQLDLAGRSSDRLRR